MNIEVLYEDNHLISVVKPSGVPVQEDSSGDEDLLNAVKDFLKKKNNKPGNVFLGMVHRLDRPVGGVMIFAKTSKAASRLSDQIRRGVWKKTYITVVDGVPEKKEDQLEDYLVKNNDTNTSKAVSKNTPGAKIAVLNYSVKSSKEKRSMLEIDLKTGRSHQIRVQLSSHKLPIVNDHKYNKIFERGKDIALWSGTLEIIHPVTKETVTFSKDAPEYFIELLKS